MRLHSLRQWFSTAAPIIFILLWSTGYLSSRIIRPHVEPLSFSAVRFAAVSLIFVVLVMLQRTPWPKDLSTWFHLAVCGILIQGIFICGMMVAITGGLDMGIGALIGGMQPILTALFASMFLGELVSRRQTAGFALGFFGLALVLIQSINLGNVPLDSLIIALLAVLGITAGTVYQKRFVTNVNLLSGTAVQFFAALIPVSALAIYFEDGQIEWNFPVVATAAWLVLAQSVGAVLILYAMIRAGAVSRVSSLFYLIPPICAVEGYVLFGERLSSLQLIGIAVVTFAVFIINRPN